VRRAGLVHCCSTTDRWLRTRRRRGWPNGRCDGQLNVPCSASLFTIASSIRVASRSNECPPFGAGCQEGLGNRRCSPSGFYGDEARAPNHSSVRPGNGRDGGRSRLAGESAKTRRKINHIAESVSRPRRRERTQRHCAENLECLHWKFTTDLLVRLWLGFVGLSSGVGMIRRRGATSTK
jgi:hypothetical protein